MSIVGVTDATLYLDTSALLNSSSGTWEKDGAVIRLGYRTENNEWKEINVTSTSGNVHSFALPEDMDKTKPIQFLRKNPYDLNNNPWNSTGDLYMVAGSATFILDDWSYGHWDIAVTEVDTIPEPVEGKQRVFYDATLSKLVYTDGNGSAAIPVGASKVIYCTYSGSESGTILMTKLTSYTKGSNIWNDVYFVDIPSGATNVRFHSGSAVSSGGDTTADAASAIPSGLTKGRTVIKEPDAKTQSL